MGQRLSGVLALPKMVTSTLLVNDEGWLPWMPGMPNFLSFCSRRAVKDADGSASGAAASGGAGVAASGDEKQFTVKEALKLQTALRDEFKKAEFQKLLRLAEVRHPRRGQRGHTDIAGFATQLQGLLLHVYRTVLPKKPWCLEPGWKGYREMTSRMASISEEPKVIAMREEINRTLGLPKHTILRPPAEEPVFVSTVDGSGSVSGYTVPLLVDTDGDVAHEFWVEDKGNGQLRRIGTAGVGAADPD